MSILDVLICEDGALVAADCQGAATLVDDPSLLYEGMSKLFPLVSINAVIGFRGVMQFGVNLAAIAAFRAGDFDKVAAELPQLCDAALALTLEQAKRDGIDTAPIEKAHAVLVGWSPQAQRVIGYIVERPGPGAPFVSKPIPYYIIAPGEEDWGLDFQRGLTPQLAMLVLARAQAAKMRELNGRTVAGTGGQLVIVEITRDSMTSSIAGSLEPGARLPGYPRERAAAA